jgi:cytochrome c5
MKKWPGKVGMRMMKRFGFWLWIGAAASAFGAVQSVKLPDGDGRRILETSCVSCHSLDKVTAQHNDKAVWEERIKMMRGYGATLDDKDLSVLLDYLVKNFGPEDSTSPPPKRQLPEGEGKELVQRICAMCHSLDRILIKKADEDLWIELLDTMISEGAEIEDDEYDVVLQYLTANFGSREK